MPDNPPEITVMRFAKPLVRVALAAAPLLLVAAALGQTPVTSAGRSALEAIRNSQPAFLVRAELNKKTRSYREGDSLSIRVASEVDACIYVVYQEADGKMYLVFPNRLQPVNRIHGHQAVQIPDESDLFRWRIQAPFGREVVKVIASKEPLQELAAPELQKQRFNPLPSDKLKGVELELGKAQAGDWAEHDIDLTTYAADHTEEARGAKRFGVFFGVSNYKFNAEYERASEGHHLNLPCCHRDARTMADLLTEVGQLNDSRVFANEKATRQQIEEMVAGWLPSVSRPGDTVFIYFSGHGMQLPGAYGGPPGAAIIPHDAVNVGILAELVKRAKAGEAVDRRVVQWLETVKKAGDLKYAGEALARETSISDDLFGRWLQALDGRRVIVILDSCFSGGFDETGKQQPEAGKSVEAGKGFEFRLFGEEFSRLKSIGQKDCALLAACSSAQTAAVRNENDLSVLTYYLAEERCGTEGTVELVQAKDYCREHMADYFRQTNAAREAAHQPPLDAHEPRLFNYCEGPVFLKP